MSFTESNTVEQMILDAATSLGTGAGSSVLREDPPAGWGGSLGEELKPSRWTYVAATLQSLMRLVVTVGTAKPARLPAGTAGKTGTAEFGHADPPQTHAWFIGFRGDLAFAVLVEDGGFGGAVAAPLARSFLQPSTLDPAAPGSFSGGCRGWKQVFCGRNCRRSLGSGSGHHGARAWLLEDRHFDQRLFRVIGFYRGFEFLIRLRFESGREIHGETKNAAQLQFLQRHARAGKVDPGL